VCNKCCQSPPLPVEVPRSMEDGRCVTTEGGATCDCAPCCKCGVGACPPSVG
jgi:hypothetical protein